MHALSLLYSVVYKRKHAYRLDDLLCLWNARVGRRRCLLRHRCRCRLLLVLELAVGAATAAALGGLAVLAQRAALDEHDDQADEDAHAEEARQCNLEMSKIVKQVRQRII